MIGGTLTLASSNPFDKPLLDPNYFSSEFDVHSMIQSIKDMQAFISTDLWKKVDITPSDNLANAQTNEQLEAYIRNQSVSIYHSIGTARMSSFGAKWGVVNPDLLVKGTRGLSIVDASIFVRAS